MEKNKQRKSTAIVAALDVGTTNVRCHIIRNDAVVLNIYSEKVNIVGTKSGHSEIEPEILWQQIVRVIHRAVQGAQLSPKEINSLALSTQRCTILAWNHRNKQYYTNFITWNDKRSKALVHFYNKSWKIRALRMFAYLFYLLTRNNRFKAASKLQFSNEQVTLRLLYEMQHNFELQEAMQRREVRLEFLDSWLLYKFRSGNGRDTAVPHISDISSCTATGLFDPYQLQWSSLILRIFRIPLHILPNVVTNSPATLDSVHPQALSCGDSNDWQHINMKISCSVSDQTAAMLGSHCLNVGDIKVTMGTGAFIEIITGPVCPAPLPQMYPLVAFQRRVNNQVKTTYCLEAAVYKFGLIIQWAHFSGLFENVAETSVLANSVVDTCGVFFITALCNLQLPIDMNAMNNGFIGVSFSTKPAHLMRAILESLAFSIVALLDVILTETQFSITQIYANGGVSQNDFLCQLLADVSGLCIVRTQKCESSIYGAAYLGFLNSCDWLNANDLTKFCKTDQIFQPSAGGKRTLLRERMQKWQHLNNQFET